MCNDSTFTNLCMDCVTKKRIDASFLKRMTGLLNYNKQIRHFYIRKFRKHDDRRIIGGEISRIMDCTFFLMVLSLGSENDTQDRSLCGGSHNSLLYGISKGQKQHSLFKLGIFLTWILYIHNRVQVTTQFFQFFQFFYLFNCLVWYFCQVLGHRVLIGVG